MSNIGNVEYSTPSRVIANVASDMDTNLATFEQRLEGSRALKQGMMQELLTRTTRLV